MCDEDGGSRRCEARPLHEAFQDACDRVRVATMAGVMPVRDVMNGGIGREGLTREENSSTTAPSRTRTAPISVILRPPPGPSSRGRRRPSARLRPECRLRRGWVEARRTRLSKGPLRPPIERKDGPTRRRYGFPTIAHGSSFRHTVDTNSFARSRARRDFRSDSGVLSGS